MKRAVLASSIALLLSSAASAHAVPRGEAKTAPGGKAIVIDYGRPSLQGRDMLGRAPVGFTWRMGADAPTTLDTAATLRFGTIAVPPGRYVLTATRTAEDTWSLNVEKRDPDKIREPGETVAAVALTTASVPESVETLTLELSAVTEGKRKSDPATVQFEMTWGTTALRTTFTAQ